MSDCCNECDATEADRAAAIQRATAAEARCAQVEAELGDLRATFDKLLGEALQKQHAATRDFTEAETVARVVAWLTRLSKSSTTLSHTTLRDYGLQNHEQTFRVAAVVLAKDIAAGAWRGKEGV